MLRKYLLISVCLLSAAVSGAQTPEPSASSREDDVAALRAELAAARAQYENTIRQIESRIDELEKVAPVEPSAADEQLLKEAQEALGGPAPAPAPQAPPPSPLVTGSAAGQSLNPQISVIGDFLGASGKGSAAESLDMREVEIAFQSVIDPFARADFFVTVPSLERVELEEGYITFLTLPSSFLARAGKVRVPFGRANAVHRPEFFAVDRPDVITTYFGEEGLSEMGVTVSRLLPNPWDKFMELEVDVLDGRNDVSFGGGTLKDLLYNVRYRAFFDLTEEHSLNLGVSYMNGVHRFDIASDERVSSQFEGVDVTYQWKPLRQGTYRSFLWQSEVIASQRGLPTGTVASWGMYSFARYQLTRRAFAGALFDYSQDPDAPEHRARAISAIWDFFPSEFQRFRAQYKYTDWSDMQSTHALLFQWYFLIGTHGAHKF